jgi:hypothetical protein
MKHGRIPGEKRRSLDLHKVHMGSRLWQDLFEENLSDFFIRTILGFLVQIPQFLRL